MPSRAVVARLWMIPLVVLVCLYFYWRWQPSGWSYAFTVVSTERSASTPPVEHRWIGEGYDYRRNVLFMHTNEHKWFATGDTALPPIDPPAVGMLELKRHNENDELGDGEPVLGHDTRRYRITDHDTLYLTANGVHRPVYINVVVTDYYVSKDDDLDNVATGFAATADSINLRLSRVPVDEVRRRRRGRRDIYKGTPLRVVSRVTWVDSAGRSGDVITTSQMTRLDHSVSHGFRERVRMEVARGSMESAEVVARMTGDQMRREADRIRDEMRRMADSIRPELAGARDSVPSVEPPKSPQKPKLPGKTR